MAAPIDWADPCAAAAALSAAYYKLLAGGQTERVRFDDREVSYAKADLVKLQAELTRMQAACAARTGGGRRRYAISAGTRR